MTKRYDIVIFGGTGFTGEYIVREMFLTASEEMVTWAVAGRSRDKIISVLQRTSHELGAGYSDVGVIIADINDMASIEEMCMQAKVLINCVGPYYLWGRQVVEGCLAGNAHYLDISGEPLFMEKMEVDYHKRAESLGLVISSACGFDSIPADVGVRFVQISFPGILTSIESYVNPVVGDTGFSVHLPTFQCVVNGFANSSELVRFRRERAQARVPKYGPLLQVKTGVWKEDGLFCVPFAGSDRSVISRTQRYLSEVERTIPAQAGVYFTFQSTGLFLYLCLVGAMFMVLVQFRCGRSLLVNYPSIFTLGVVSKQGATKEQIRQARFSVTLKGKGYSLEVKGAPDRQVCATVSGPDPGYVSCSRFISQAAYSILKHGPRHVGVVTPGAMLNIEDYINRLRGRGITFKIDSIDHI